MYRYTKAPLEDEVSEERISRRGLVKKAFLLKGEPFVRLFEPTLPQKDSFTLIEAYCHLQKQVNTLFLQALGKRRAY